MTLILTIPLPDGVAKELEAACQAHDCSAQILAAEYLLGLLHGEHVWPDVAQRRTVLEEAASGALSSAEAIARLDAASIQHLGRLAELHGLSLVPNEGKKNLAFEALINSKIG